VKKEVKNGQGFICKDLEEKKRIWEKLIQHRYPMFADGNDPCYKHIVWEDGEFVEANQKYIQPLNEAEFFDEGSTFGVDFANTDSADSIAYVTNSLNKEMTHEQKLEYMSLAGGIVGFRFSEKDLDMLVSTYDLIIYKQGATDVSDLSKVKAEVNSRHKTEE
jgi:hypothetical protein